MSDEPRRLTTEEERARLYATRSSGGSCALCGRKLGDDEPIYWETFIFGTVGVFGTVGGIISRPRAPVAAECASPRLVEEKRGELPELCAGCDRPVYYGRASRARRLAVCSKSCYQRANRLEHRAASHGARG
jgi:hypothetical protein